MRKVSSSKTAPSGGNTLHCYILCSAAILIRKVAQCCQLQLNFLNMDRHSKAL
jgi:hypothetical protein